MSYCYLHAILPVSEGRRVQTVRGNGTVVWHAVYDTMFYTETSTEIDGFFRAFSPATESTLRSDSLIMAHGKFALPLGLTGGDDVDFIVESLHHNVFIADPEDENYDSFLPVDNVPSLSILGNVVGSVVHMPDAAKAVDVRVSTYVQGKNMDCIYRCRFPPTPRWSKVNMPIAGSVISVFGRPHSTTFVNGTPILIVTVEDIVYNPGTAHILADGRSDLTTSPRRLQVRKKRIIVGDLSGGVLGDVGTSGTGEASLYDHTTSSADNVTRVVRQKKRTSRTDENDENNAPVVKEAGASRRRGRPKKADAKVTKAITPNAKSSSKGKGKMVPPPEESLSVPNEDAGAMSDDELTDIDDGVAPSGTQADERDNDGVDEE